MDYGKSAYLKAEELEARLNSTAKVAGRESSVCRTVRPLAEIGNSPCFVARIKGEGALALFVQATLTDAPEAGELAVIVGGLKAGAAAFTPADGRAEAFVMCSAYVDGYADVFVSASVPATLRECRVLVYGAGAETGSFGGEAAVDGGHGKWALVFSEQNDVKACLFTEENFALGDSVYLGTGTMADVAATEQGYLFVYVDGERNLFAVRTDDSLALVSRTLVAQNSEGCAAARYRGGAVIAGIFGGETRCFVMDGGGGLSLPFTLNTGVTATRVRFVKNIDPPRIIVSAEAGSFLLSCEEENGGKSALNAAVSLSVSGAQGE